MELLFTFVTTEKYGHIVHMMVTEVKTFFVPNLGVFGLQLQFELTDGYEMMHTA